MLIPIPEVLTKAELETIQTRLAGAAWEDGRATAGHQSARVKHNLQLAETSADARELGDVVLKALGRNPLFMTAALPRAVFPPLFNKYEEGMSFGAHVDNAIRALPGSGRSLRTDLSATLFLNDDYDGGELLIDDAAGGARAVKLPAGSMILYPATTLHRVAPVTRGARLAAFFWIQSMVKDEGERRLLFDLDRAIVEVARGAPDHPSVARLTSVYHNLVRKWGEV
jgi:PKHD-type hydroxylase